jgi:hypothetical protein
MSSKPVPGAVASAGGMGARPCGRRVVVVVASHGHGVTMLVSWYWCLGEGEEVCGSCCNGGGVVVTNRLAGIPEGAAREVFYT